MNNDAVLWVTIENQSKNISVVKKKLEDEMRMGDLECFSSWQFRQVYFVRDKDA